MAVKSDNRLGCGRDIDDVWSRTDQAPTVHESHCSHCQAARHSLSDLNDATQQLKSQDVQDPALHLPSELLNKVTSIARAEVRRGNRIPLHRPNQTQEPTLTISEQAIATVIRHASDQLPGIEASRCTARTDEDTPGSAQTPVTIAVELYVSVSATSPIPDQITELRTKIIDALHTEIGLDAATIDVFVQDLHDA